MSDLKEDLRLSLVYELDRKKKQEALMTLSVLIDHWREDKASGLTPTDTTLDFAKETIMRAME